MTQVSHMTLDDLKTGMIVTMRNGTQYTVIRNMATPYQNADEIFVYTNFNQSERLTFNDDGRGWMPFDDYHNNFTHKRNKRYDIVRVEIANNPFGFMDLKYNVHFRTVIWKEPLAVKLTLAEIEARLGYKIEIVSEEE